MSRYSLNWVVATWAFTRLLLLHIVRDLHKLVMKKKNGKMTSRVVSRGCITFQQQKGLAINKNYQLNRPRVEKMRKVSKCYIEKTRN